MKDAIKKIRDRYEGELAVAKQCEEKGTGVLHTAVVATQNAAALKWCLKILESAKG